MGFNLDKVNLGASHLPQAIEDQMQQKMGAQQQAQQAEYELQKQTTLAKAAVAKAEGEANSAVVLAQGQATANKKILETLSPMLIEFRKIEKWNGQLPTYSGGQALINLTPTTK
jgi:regulator of protease activity HflC (stomatin/prohibitin superfamily)